MREGQPRRVEELALESEHAGPPLGRVSRDRQLVSPAAAPTRGSAGARVPPAVYPGAGWTTPPAALSTPRRCSSEYAIVSSGGATCGTTGSGSGVTSTLSPPASL